MINISRLNLLKFKIKQVKRDFLILENPSWITLLDLFWRGSSPHPPRNKGYFISFEEKKFHHEREKYIERKSCP